MSNMKSSSDLHDLSVLDLAAKLTAREVSSVEVTQHFLARITQENLGAFLATNADVSLAQAKAADARLAAGERTPLLGVPLAHKDVFVTRDFPTTAGSKMLENYRSPFDASVVKNLGLEGAGMVTLGKLNCDEFAMGSGNDNSAYKPVKNPWDLERIPGGSSGGSAAAVAARLVPAATGTDTGGSIRQPASLTGITGIKPTYGRCSRYG
ncbi:MAG: amidase, partial [Polaromonas sp.]|nr:amidase [Polaromonas sp.]